MAAPSYVELENQNALLRMFNPSSCPVGFEVPRHLPVTPRPSQPSAVGLAEMKQAEQDDLNMPRVPQKTSDRPRTCGQLDETGSIASPT